MLINALKHSYTIACSHTLTQSTLMLFQNCELETTHERTSIISGQKIKITMATGLQNYKIAAPDKDNK